MRDSRTPSVVVIDSGETIFDETRTWSIWADRLGIPVFTLFVTLGGVLAQGRPFHDVFGRFQHGFDLDTELKARSAAGVPHVIEASDLYPDVRPALEQLRVAGIRTVLASNLTGEGEDAVQRIGLPIDHILGSSQLGYANREPEFYRRLCTLLDVTAQDVLYVSHRIDTALPAARAAGLTGLYLQRGPIAHIMLGTPADAAETRRIRLLTELPQQLGTASGIVSADQQETAR